MFHLWTDKVKAVLKVLKEMQKDKERQDVITEENFTLCRIIYKLNAQLRSEKTLQILKRVCNINNNNKSWNLLPVIYSYDH